MLLFIDVEPDVPFTEIYFNTSHVTVYQHITCQSTTETEFQYISCYCLSTATLLIACCVPYFNTSHVTVYLTHYQTGISITIFQYISCYCLSLLPFRLYDPVLLFQYISCYCLSSPGFNVGLSYSRFQYISCYCLSLIGVHFQRGHRISIHLMLLFIKMIRLERANVMHFNTSHVTVYQKALFGISQPSNISIHLMLLFIFLIRTPHTFIANFNTSHVTVYHYPGFFCSALRKFQYISCYCLSRITLSQLLKSSSFQYISCYCLSTCFYNARAYIYISIHLMLLFIVSDLESTSGVLIISIHLMLLFIKVGTWQTLQLNNFNTSHVTVYRIVWQKLDSGRNFNTSHVTVYRATPGAQSDWLVISIHLMLLFIPEPHIFQTLDIISIHLMLLFIAVQVKDVSTTGNFNTSHVTVYHNQRIHSLYFYLISIHLMLLFILSLDT